MTKVKVTREIAETIEDLRPGTRGPKMSDYGIVVYLVNSNQRLENPKLNVLYTACLGYDAKLTPYDLMRALVNGYEVEYTPEESARAYHDRIAGLVAKHNYSFDHGILLGIKNTLDILGIKINDGDAE